VSKPTSEPNQKFILRPFLISDLSEFSELSDLSELPDQTLIPKFHYISEEID
jgi:hypothetical protein